MDFSWTKEHEMLKQSVRDFAEEVLGPQVADRDEREYFDRAVFDGMAKLGLSIPLPLNGWRRYG